MTVWYHHSTIFKQRRILQIAGILTLCVALITTLFFGIMSAYAAPNVTQVIGFQGRLLDSSKKPVADGYYNIQFKIYEGGAGNTPGNTGGTLKWTETYINDGISSGVYVKDGYMSAQLGSLTPFGNSVDWNQSNLWLSMNIAGSSAGCTAFGEGLCVADGEMLPMKRITATPFSINSALVGGKSVDELIHNGSTQQTGNFNISGTGIAGILQGSTRILTPELDTAAAGAMTIGKTNATSIEIGSANVASVTIQGGSMGVAINSGSNVAIGLGEDGGFTIKNSTNESVLEISDDGTLTNNGVIASKSDTIQLQGGAVPINLLTAVNNQGVANVGIGNAAENGYALDVTGQINASESYSINGVSVLNNTSLSFGGNETSTISAAGGQSLQLNAEGGVKIGDGNDLDEPTLLTLDSSANTPLASGSSVLGSMYYDTTLGKVQCYEADGWGSCSASPDRFVTLNPEYANAVTNGSSAGDFTSGICSDALDLSDGTSGQSTICGTNETYNFYAWNTNELTPQTKDIFVTYQLPANFTEFIEGSTSLMGRTDDDKASVDYQIYKNTSSGLVACGTSIAVSTGVQSLWQKASASGLSDPSGCDFAPGDSIVFKISLTSEYTTKTTNAYVSALSFAFGND